MNVEVPPGLATLRRVGLRRLLVLGVLCCGASCAGCDRGQWLALGFGVSLGWLVYDVFWRETP